MTWLLLCMMPSDIVIHPLSLTSEEDLIEGNEKVLMPEN